MTRIKRVFRILVIAAIAIYMLANKSEEAVSFLYANF